VIQHIVQQLCYVTVLLHIIHYTYALRTCRMDALAELTAAAAGVIKCKRVNCRTKKHAAHNQHG
jgi:hypothetical protein